MITVERANFANKPTSSRLLIFSVWNFFSGICVVEFFSTAKIPLSVCMGGGIFKAWWNFSTTQIPLLILEYLSVWRNYFWWYFSILKLLF